LKSNLKVPLFDLDYGAEENKAVLRVLRSKWLTMGAETELFEKEFASYIGVKHAIAVSSCTTALHLANIAVGVNPGDEVVCPSLTFVATANAILYAGAKPVFADVISQGDWTLSPDAIKQKITKKTKAILVMHYAGFACDMDKIGRIAEEHQLKIIEDAAHGLGSYYGSRKLGSVGDISCFSFFTNKNVSTGEGGMVCTDNDEYAHEIRLMRSHGMTSLTLDRHKGHVFNYDVVRLGFNYRIGEIQAALGRVQLQKLDAGNKRRIAAADRYKRRLAIHEKIKTPFTERLEGFNYHIFPVLLSPDIDRDDFMKYLREKGIQTSIHYTPVHAFSYYRKIIKNSNCPITEEIGNHVMTLPMYPTIKDDQIDFVLGHIDKYIKRRITGGNTG
jgi:dTDP-4-amino-4,6-dideoxygalactose transaminase